MLLLPFGNWFGPVGRVTTFLIHDRTYRTDGCSCHLIENILCLIESVGSTGEAMSENSATRVLVVVFDALRPEFVTPELMPNLAAFANGGVRYPNSHSIFLTETRVNQTGVVTGCLPQRNGIVANVMMAHDVWSDRILNTGIEDEIRAAFEQTGDNRIC